MPGPGASGSGKSFIQAVEYLSRIDIMMDVVYDHDDPVETKFEFLGRELSMPVMGAPCGGAQFNFGIDPETVSERAFVYAQLRGAVDAGVLGFMPDGPKNMTVRNHMDRIPDLGGMVIPTVKPWENAKIIELFREAEEGGALACATDIDSAGLINLRITGTPAEPKSRAELRELAECTRLPVLVKGIVTPKAAKAALEEGAAGIIISNHGGRIMEDCPAPVSVLQEIREAVGRDALLIVDGGVRTGGDVFKCLALGADAVLIGRPLCIASIGGGAEGVKLYLDKLRDELYTCMVLTGCKSLADISPDKIRNRNSSSEKPKAAYY